MTPDLVPDLAIAMKAKIKAVCDTNSDPLILSPDIHRYHAQYALFLEQAARIEDADAEMLALAVYGWMPTIMRTFNYDRLGSEVVSGGLRVLRSARPDDAFSLLCKMDRTAAVNHSWVGTSKFLHFLNPHVFPIWDSRVARAVGIKSYKLNRRQTYTAYLEAIHQIATYDAVTTVQQRLEASLRAKLSRIRAIELCLFVSGKR